MAEPLQIPTIGTHHDRAIVTSEMADRTALAERFAWLRDSLEGGGGYEDFVGAYSSDTGERVSMNPPTTYLQRYPRESAAKWNRRREGATYPNYIQWVVGVACGLLTRESPNRQGYPREVDDWISAARWDKYRVSLFRWAMAYGWLPVVVDAPRRGPAASQAAQDKGGVYVAPIHPDSILDLAWDGEGLAWIKYQEPVLERPDPLKPAKSGMRVWVLCRTGWWFWDLWDDGPESKERTIPVVDAGLWEGPVQGRVPVAVFSVGANRQQLRQRSWVEYPARIMRRLYNVRSQKAATQDGSCFPIYQYPVKSRDDLKMLKVGDSTAVPYWADSSHVPGFAPYDVGPAGVMATEEQHLIRQLKELVSLAFDEGSADTGIAKSYAFLQLNVTLAGLVASLERLELDVMDLVARFLGLADGLPEEAVPGYPVRFDLLDARQDIELAGLLLDMEFGPQARVEIKRRALLGRFLQELPADTVRLIEAELDEEATGEGADDNEPPPEDEQQPPTAADEELTPPLPGLPRDVAQPR